MNNKLPFALLLAIFFFCSDGCTTWASQLQDEVKTNPSELDPNEESEIDSMVLHPPPNWVGDFSGMRERQMIRMLVPYSKTFFYIDKGHQKEINYQYGKELERWLNKNYPVRNRAKGWQVLFTPLRRDQLLPVLQEGKGDLAAGGLTITEARRTQVDFFDSLAKGVKEVLITGPRMKPIRNIDDLAGKEITVRASSSYYEHLLRLNTQFKERKLKPIRIVRADEWLESEDILEMVNAGLVKATVVDHYLAEIWQPLYKAIRINDSIAINNGGELAWACRKNSPELQSVMSTFMRQHKVGTTFGNIQVAKYIRNSDIVHNATSVKEMRKFINLVKHFRKYGGSYNFDYLMLMAQGYQDSRLNQKARSKKGAVGVMQLLRSTAADPAVGIPHIDRYAGRNIEAGAKYLRFLTENYLNEEQITPVNKTLLAFAPYNAGPGNLRKFCRLAEKSGYDPDVWFQNVEWASARIVGQETVRYIANIYKYYLACAAVEKHRMVKEQRALQ